MKKLKLIDYLYICICYTFVIGFILYLYHKGLILGSSVDWSSQHINIPEYLRTLFYSNGKLIPSFALNLGMGQNIYYLSYYGLLSPIILISYILPTIPMYIFIPTAAVSMLLISIFMLYHWIYDKYDSKIAFVVAILFTLSGPMIYHTHRHIMFVLYMPFLIGALKSVDSYFKNKNSIPLILYTFLMIMTSYYFSASGIIVIGIYTLYLILKSNKKLKLESFKPLLKIIYFVIISILLSATLLLPTIYTLSLGRLTTHNVIGIMQMFIPKINMNLSLYYSYSLGLGFIYIVSIIYALISKKKENILFGIILSICILFPVASYILNGFMYIDGKCFIPFLPVALLIISEFLNDLFHKEIDIKKILLIALPVCIFMVYCNIDNPNTKFLLFDILTITIGLILGKKLKKSDIIIIPMVMIAIVACINTNNIEKYEKINTIIKQNDVAYKELTNLISDNNLYRTANNDIILNNTNKIYSTKELLTTMYSSSSNKNYINFVHNVFQNEIINKDNTTITQTSNVLFNVYSGSKYLITSSKPLIGYQKIKTINGVSLYQNNDVLPLGYATNKVMSLREFNTLKYPETLDALLNYVIVDKALDNVYESNIEPFNDKFTLTSTNNLKYSTENDHYIIHADKKSTAVIKLNKKVKGKALIIAFKMNKSKPGYSCSTDITINGINNSLSCSNWKYYNDNNTFDYVLSSNDAIDTLNIELTQGTYDISDINIYTLNYDVIKRLKNNIDTFYIDQTNSTDNHLIGTIDVKNDGYFKLTIPYESQGFKVYLDGKRVGKVKVDTAFIGIPITKGTHRIDLTYTTPYLKKGIIISLIGILLLTSLIFYKDLEKPLLKIKDFLIKYLIWCYKRIKKLFIENKKYVLLFISLFILDLSLRIFYTKDVNFYNWRAFVPNMFSVIWILLILNITKLLNRRWGKVFYLIYYIFSLIMFLVHAIYFSYFKLFFDYKVMSVAGEGADYYDTVLLNIKYWVVIVSIISVILTIKGLKKLNHIGKFSYYRLLIILAAFTLLHMGMPIFLGSKNSNIEWDEWRNTRSVYSEFNDNNKSMMVAGMYEYNIRNFYVNFLKDTSKLSASENNILKDNFKDISKSVDNTYTGAFKGKNLIIVQMESIDEFLLDKNIMPTLYSVSKKSINFTNHYSFTSGGGSTFNSEFMVNTGYSTAYHTNENAYLFSRNTYTYSLPNLFKNLDYSTNAYHMNSAEYYSRGVNYKAFGYDNYNGLKDQNNYKKNEYLLDRELINNKKFNKGIFGGDNLKLSYIITYTAHMPYKTTSGTCGMLTEEQGLTEEECLHIQAKETDDAIKLLFDNLAKNNSLDNTVVVFFADHYLYTLEDQTILNKYKETDNNLINHTPFMIWSNGQIVKTVSKVNSQLDILPTILNLFGIEYYPNNYIGRDILDSKFDPIVFFSDGSWYNGKTYVANGEYQSGKSMNAEDINKYNTLVKRKMLLNDAILKSDYFLKK